MRGGLGLAHPRLRLFMHDQMLGLAGLDLFLWIAVAALRFVQDDHFISPKENCNIFRNFFSFVAIEERGYVSEANSNQEYRSDW